jgi:hypothetical protein
MSCIRLDDRIMAHSSLTFFHGSIGGLPLSAYKLPFIKEPCHYISPGH